MPKIFQTQTIPVGMKTIEIPDLRAIIIVPGNVKNEDARVIRYKQNLAKYIPKPDGTMLKNEKLVLRDED